MEELFEQIALADEYTQIANDLSDAIVALSNHKDATDILTQEIRRLYVAAERKWQEIEQSDEFKARYTDRLQANSDFWRSRKEKNID